MNVKTITTTIAIAILGLPTIAIAGISPAWRTVYSPEVQATIDVARNNGGCRALAQRGIHMIPLAPAREAGASRTAVYRAPWIPAGQTVGRFGCVKKDK